MKKFLASTALALVLAGGYAVSTSHALTAYQADSTDIRASVFIGQRVYATEQMPTTDVVDAGVRGEWDDIGEVNEVIMGRDGSVKAVILGIGGFLGLGEKDIAVPMADVKFVRSGETASDYFLVINANKQALTDLPGYTTPEEVAATEAETGQDTAASSTTTTNDTAATDTTTTTTTTTNDTAATDTATTTEDTAATDTATTTPAEPAATNDTAATTDATGTDATATSSTTAATTDRPMLTRPEVTRDGFAAAPVEELTSEKLTGAVVYGQNDENVGEINRLVMDDSGKITTVVVDVGGFLGMGEREIGVSMDELNIVRSQDGSDVRVYIDANIEALKAQPEYRD